MNIRELNDEQAEQLGKTLEAWTEWCHRWEGVYARQWEADVYKETVKLQEMLQPPKTYLVVWDDSDFGAMPRSIEWLRENAGCADIKALYEWRDGEGTVGKPITGEPLRELLEGEASE